MNPKKITALIIAWFVLASAISFSGESTDILLYQRVDELMREKNFTDARALLERMIKKNNSDYVALAALGEIYAEEGNRKKAIKFVKRSININPEYPFSHFLLGRLYFLTQNEKKAVEEFNLFKEKTLSLLNIMDQDDRELYLARLQYICEAYFNMKISDEYKMAVDAMLFVDPKNQTAAYNMGVYYYVFGHNRPKAYEYFKKAKEIEPSTYIGKKAEYAIDFIRNNPDTRIAPDFSFLDRE